MLKPLRIGSLALAHNVVLAPLAGITNLPFRILCRSAGASLGFTEMISVNGLLREGGKTLKLLKSCQEDRPLGIQLFGDTPKGLAEAARMVAGYGDLLDINMGCPVRKVVGTGAGSALLQEPLKIAAIIREVRKAASLPLTVKIRSGWNAGELAYREIGIIAESEGCDAITLHPRSRSQMFSGKSDWKQLLELKELLSIPVIGSGDLFTPDDCIRMLSETGCDGIMVARGCLGAPWVFRQVIELQAKGSFTPVRNAERGATIRQHFDLFLTGHGETVAVREMKKHIGWYAKGFAGAADIRREANMASSKADINSIAERISEIPDAFETSC
jgi:tRNA-dihydrouridine synthase B